ncbi:hypothetical protein OSTOST_04741 [Ostertagia ostertagi]
MMLWMRKEDVAFLILACDGLWKSFDNEEAISYVNELLGKSVKRTAELYAALKKPRELHKMYKLDFKLSASCCSSNLSLNLHSKEAPDDFCFKRTRCNDKIDKSLRSMPESAQREFFPILIHSANASSDLSTPPLIACG